MNPISELSSALSQAVAQVSPSVVRVEGRARGSSSGLVWSAQGHIVTAEHTVQHDEGITVGFSDGATAEARLVGRDPSTGVALLEVKGKQLAPPAWAEAGSLAVGQLALVVARPGKSARATLGVISALGAAGEAFRTPRGGKLDRYVETDVAPRAGFSGGAVLTTEGKAVGLHTTGLLRDTALVLTQGTLERAVATLLAHGGARRGFLGIGTYPVRLPAALEKQLGQGSGLLVVSVAADSPADKSGVLMGDLLVSLAGQPVRHMGDLLGLLDEEHIGQDAPVKVVRAGESKDLRITIAARA